LPPVACRGPGPCQGSEVAKGRDVSPPQVLTAVRIHHVVTGYEIDPAVIEEAIRLSEEKYCSVGAMVQKSASFHTTSEIVEDKTAWMKPALVVGAQS
jgi:hypothetical protein